MNRAGAVFVETGNMVSRRVALVPGEIVFRVQCVHFDHDPVAGDLRDDARRGDAETERIAIHKRGLGQRKWMDGQPVDEDMLGRDGETRDSEAHGVVRGAQDVEAIDFLDAHGDDAPMDFGIGRKLGVDCLAGGRGEFFGIVQTFVPEFLRKDHGGCNDRAGERAAPGFIDAGHELDAVFEKVALVSEVATHHRANLRNVGRFVTHANEGSPNVGA